jgi:hypothetical protein
VAQEALFVEPEPMLSPLVQPVAAMDNTPESRATSGASVHSQSEKDASNKSGKKPDKNDSRLARPTLFGEKLQAVLELRK